MEKLKPMPENLASQLEAFESETVQLIFCPVSLHLSNCKLKGTVFAISSEPPNKSGNARFTMVPFKALYELDINVLSRKMFNFENENKQFKES